MAARDNKINICNRALFAIGAEEITSFEDGTAESRVASIKYETAKNDLLSIYYWTFALSESYLARVDTNNEQNIYKHQYQLPEDCLRAVSLSEDGGSVVPYTFRNSMLNTDAERPILKYVSTVSEAVMPAYFVSLLIDRLARDFLIPITAKNDDYALFDNIYQNNLVRAKNADAQARTPRKVDSTLLLKVR